jgi:iron complex transport system substrate-binding protein
MSPLPTRSLARCAAFVVSAAALVACAGNEVDDAASTADRGSPTTISTGSGNTAYPLTIDNCGRDVTFDKAPERVVVLNGSSVAEVQSFVVLGLEDRIVANAQSYGVSDDPTMLAKVAAIPTGGVELNDNFEVPREQILAQQPDLVVSTWAGGFDETNGTLTRDQLDELGIDSFVTPSNCALYASDPRPEDQNKLDEQSYESSFELIETLGAIFGVPDRAADVVADLRARIEAVEAPSGDTRPSVLVVFPGMSAMNASGLPAIFSGSLYDSLIETAGGVNSFKGVDQGGAAQINAEALAAADVDLLVVGVATDTEDPQVAAESLFEQFPSWTASQTKNWVSVSDGIYLGPHNAIAIEKIAAGVARAQ